MSRKAFIAMVLLTTTATLAHAEDSAKDPKTGKNCVSYFSSEMTSTGQVQMNFRNICASAFQIHVLASGRTRDKDIEAGSPETPARVSLICKPEERCEAAKWQYE